MPYTASLLRIIWEDFDEESTMILTMTSLTMKKKQKTKKRTRLQSNFPQERNQSRVRDCERQRNQGCVRAPLFFSATEESI